jgi:hypothetical protein
MRSLVNPQKPPTGLGIPVIVRATIGLAVIASLGACAGVRVTPLNPDGTVAAGAKEGMRYYMPAPYLLVARIPLPPPASPTSRESNDTQDASNNGPKSKDAKDNKKDEEQGSSSAPIGGAPSTNTSFLASTPLYVLKLVYLPDKTQPMAMSVRTGLFGTASMKPGLQDGWMLTSLDASADSKTAETLTAIASLVSSAATAGAGAPVTKSLAAGGKIRTETTTFKDGQVIEKRITEKIPDFSDQILKPGLYKFVYDSSGQLIGLHAVTYFTDKGVLPAAYVHTISGK